MPFCRASFTYWCDKCGRECVVNWKDSGDIYLVLKCTKCDWAKPYVELDDVARRYGYNSDHALSLRRWYEKRRKQ